MKVEMRKFMNLVNNRIQKRNNLVSMDYYRVYPLNQIANGQAKPAKNPIVFDDSDCYLKWHPKLFGL